MLAAALPTWTADLRIAASAEREMQARHDEILARIDATATATEPDSRRPTTLRALIWFALGVLSARTLRVR